MENQDYVIMLVDDDPSANFIHGMVIQEAEAAENVMVALNGQQALDQMETLWNEKKTVPDLLLLDINMPVMNGEDFLNAHYQLDEEKRVKKISILLTTEISEMMRYRLTTLHPGLFFTNKPLSPESLQGLIDARYEEL